MSISDQGMEHLKTLARLKLGDEETQALKDDLNKILAYFEQIRDLDTEGVEELARPIDSFNVFREDILEQGLTQQEALALATEAEEGFFKVPRTIDTD